MLEVSKEACLYSMKFKSQLTIKLEKKPPKSVTMLSRAAVSKDQRLTRSICKLDLR